VSERKQQIAHHIRSIMELLGLDVEDSAFLKTPDRVADLYVDKLFASVGASPPQVQRYLEPATHHEQVTIRDLPFISLCAHHLTPMVGHVTIAYLPRQFLIGLSKFQEIIHYYARRPQLQERLTRQLVDALVDVLQTPDVSVKIVATHCCVLMHQSHPTCAETFAASGSLGSGLSRGC